eukprot:TRINITY_DN2718_c0_g1_i1.p1 TRINITY_DN2718_c0_g1~~TRINITY_DN2718_c0_g1_i1.p1  ORF type:complete len:430 (+),score=98.89 TRINITY_DN2718_c0_g1_i1:70-1290(+)
MIHPSLYLESVDNGIIMKSSTFLPAGETVLSIPRAATTVTLDTSFNDLYMFGYYIAYLRKQFQDDSYINHSLLPGQPIFEQYQPYFSSLPLALRLSPLTCHTGLSFDKQDLVLLDDRARRYLKEIHQQLLHTLQQFTRSISDGSLHPLLNKTVASSISYSDLEWGFCVIASRSFSDPEMNFLLMPVGDLINHEIGYNTIWDFDDGANWVWKTLKPIQSNQELLTSYGNKENLELMVTYGFVLGYNPNEILFIPALRINDPVLESIMNQLVPRNLLYWIEYTALNSFHSNDLMHLRMALLPQDLKSSYHISQMLSGVHYKLMEEKMWQYIESSILTHLNPQQLQRDEANLAYAIQKYKLQLKERSKKLWYNRKLIYEYRVAQQYAWKQYLHTVQLKLEHLQSQPPIF